MFLTVTIWQCLAVFVKQKKLKRQQFLSQTKNGTRMGFKKIAQKQLNTIYSQTHSHTQTHTSAKTQQSDGKHA